MTALWIGTRYLRNISLSSADRVVNVLRAVKIVSYSEASSQPRLLQSRYAPKILCSVALQVRESSKGFGLFAAEPLRSGTFVCLYAGEIISRSQARERWKAREGLGNYVLVLRESSRLQTMLTIIESVYENA